MHLLYILKLSNAKLPNWNCAYFALNWLISHPPTRHRLVKWCVKSVHELKKDLRNANPSLERIFRAHGCDSHRLPTSETQFDQCRKKIKLLPKINLFFERNRSPHAWRISWPTSQRLPTYRTPEVNLIFPFLPATLQSHPNQIGFRAVNIKWLPRIYANGNPVSSGIDFRSVGVDITTELDWSCGALQAEDGNIHPGLARVPRECDRPFPDHILLDFSERAHRNEFCCCWCCYCNGSSISVPGYVIVSAACWKETSVTG